jgi:hypothetical protein
MVFHCGLKQPITGLAINVGGFLDSPNYDNILNLPTSYNLSMDTAGTVAHVNRTQGVVGFKLFRQ